MKTFLVCYCFAGRFCLFAGFKILLFVFSFVVVCFRVIFFFFKKLILLGVCKTYYSLIFIQFQKTFRLYPFNYCFEPFFFLQNSSFNYINPSDTIPSVSYSLLLSIFHLRASFYVFSSDLFSSSLVIYSAVCSLFLKPPTEFFSSRMYI